MKTRKHILMARGLSPRFKAHKQRDYSKTKLRETYWACTFACVSVILNSYFDKEYKADEIIALFSKNRSLMNFVCKGATPASVFEVLISAGIPKRKIHYVEAVFNKIEEYKLKLEFLCSKGPGILFHKKHAVAILSIENWNALIMEPDNLELDFEYTSICNLTSQTLAGKYELCLILVEDKNFLNKLFN